MPHLNLLQWVETLGYVGVLVIIFLETGVFVAFFLPGDSLLFTVGLLASQNIFHIWTLIPLLIITAIAGYFFAYWYGKKLGSWLLKREDSFWFKKRYLIQAEKFYSKHGGKALVFGRLIPVLRTFVPLVAGMVRMRYADYLLFNILGAFLWAGGVTLLGYYLGHFVPNAGHYLLPIIFVVIMISLFPAVIQYFKTKAARKRKSSNDS